MAVVAVHAHQVRVCHQCETLWAVGHHTRLRGPENLRCDDCGALTDFHRGTHLMVLLDPQDGYA